MQEEPSVEAVFHHHLEAFKNNDLEELIKDYTNESEIWSPEGKIIGLEGIAAFFTYVFTLLPKDSTRFELKYLVAKEEKVYILWNAESPFISIPFASDCFEINRGKILWQSIAAHIVAKQA
jgi:hypothetical protein